MFRYGVGSILFVILLAAVPASASGPGDVPWTPRGLVGTPVLAVEPMSGDLYVGAADGLHILDLQANAWRSLSRDGVAGWPVTAIGRSPYRADRVVTGRVDGDGLGAIALTALVDGATDVCAGQLPGALSSVGFINYFGDYRLWACVPAEGASGLTLQSGDNGDTWVPLAGHGFVHPRAFAASLEVVGGDIVARTYLAGEGGVTYTNDHGATWAADGTGLPAGGVNDMALANAYIIGVPDKSDDSFYGFAATDAGLFFRPPGVNPWQLLLAEPCRKVRCGEGPSVLDLGFVCILTSEGRLLGGVLAAGGVAAWTDLSSELPATVITDFGVRGSFLAVGTQADGVFTKVWQSSSAADLPAAPRLDLAAAPNPFNPATTISFVAPASGPARLAIYDLQGRLVAVLLYGPVAAGPVQCAWRPDREASGVFVARLEWAGTVATRRVALIR